jgi:hypothetical protein
LFVGVRGGTTTKDKYIFEKAEESVKGHAKSFSNRYTNHGHLNELEAIEMFAKVTGFNVEYLEQEYFPINENCGSTPDAKVVDWNGITLASVDVKCPPETFFAQKMMQIREAKPEYQNVPKQMFMQGQMQMMSLGVDTHYLVRYLTAMEVTEYGEKIEYDLPLETRLYYKVIKADLDVQKKILELVEEASTERDLLIKIFKQPIL